MIFVFTFVLFAVYVLLFELVLVLVLALVLSLPILKSYSTLGARALAHRSRRRRDALYLCPSLSRDVECMR